MNNLLLYDLARTEVVLVLSQIEEIVRAARKSIEEASETMHSALKEPNPDKLEIGMKYNESVQSIEANAFQKIEQLFP